MQWGVVRQNVASGISTTRDETNEINALPVDHVNGILAKMEGRAIHVIGSVLLSKGMRRGELCALRWQDVDLDGAKIKVEQALEITKAGGVRFKSTKNRLSRRSI